VIHVASSHPGTWIERRSTLTGGGWQRICAAPCDREIIVQGTLLRASAPGMTPSNAFRVEPGPGVAVVKVEGGSSSTRSYGVLGLAAGLPVALAGMTLYGYGTYAHEDGKRIAGGVTLGIGAIAVVVALPLLVLGGTNVRDGKDNVIASLADLGRF
jgi:hypothetical protein